MARRNNRSSNNGTRSDAATATAAAASRATVAASSEAPAEASTTASSSSTSRRRNADQAMTHAISVINDQTRKPNTDKSYKPKIAEFREYCDWRWSSIPAPQRYAVDNLKLYEFLFYQSFRERYKRGGARRTSNHGFDHEDFKAVFQTYTGSRNPGESCPEPENPLGADSVGAYRSAVRLLWEEQQSDPTIENLPPWEFVYNRKVRELYKLVTNRRHRIKKARYDEKLDGEFAPYAGVDEVPSIEEAIFKRGMDSTRGCFAALRNRFVFLLSFSGILRCESVFGAELSDMLGISFQKRNSDHHPLFMLVIQLAFGKKLCVFMLL